MCSNTHSLFFIRKIKIYDYILSRCNQINDTKLALRFQTHLLKLQAGNITRFFTWLRRPWFRYPIKRNILKEDIIMTTYTEYKKESVKKVFNELKLKGFKIDKDGFLYRIDKFTEILGDRCEADIEYEHEPEGARFYVKEIVVRKKGGERILILGDGEIYPND